MQDVHLIFPPQWSPFQPFLSTPSLKAYLEQRGFSVRQSDWNVDFYDFFIGRDRLPEALDRLQRYVRDLPAGNDAYRNHAYLALGILNDYPAKRRKAEGLRSHSGITSIEAFHENVTAFKRLLYAFSVAEPVIEVGTSSLMAGQVMRSMESIDEFCADPDSNPFLPFFRAKVAGLDEAPRYFGISVIGTEQVLPALTLGGELKRRFPTTPIVIGGSVFSRLVDRTGEIGHLFRRYFDFIIRYEGERPLEALLSAADPVGEQTPGLAFLDGGRIVTTPLLDQLKMDDIPTPDFGDLDLGRYFTPEIVLPLLSTRGCYWDKCAFCYHGMIYGDRYRMRSPQRLLEDVERLNARHAVSHFALNDEAIPPKLFEKLPTVFPKNRYYFTGLYKFEKYFEPQHFQGMYDIGFRSLYIGLESASERVQRHMRKDNTQGVMLANLQDAHDAGIWNHTFNFFGFPTETEAEAMETANFLIEHADIIHSEGTGTFSFEHNAPIAKHPDDYGVTRVVERPGNVLELYYDYEAAAGLSQQEAADMVQRFSEMKRFAGVYRYSGWIPREHLLVLLSHFPRDALRESLATLDGELQSGTHWSRNLSWFSMSGTAGADQRYFVVNAQSGKVLETNRDALLILEFMPKETPVSAIVSHFPVFEQVMH
ncbi:radical SAM protein [Pseudomonas sp. R2.Fl]|nr:radical SAM protein [Pseudomonas sp. R2.Fl]